MDYTINNTLVENHSIAKKCLSSLYEISEHDYRGEDYFPKERHISALDMDTYARKLTPTRSSVDAVIGVCDYDGKKRSKERFLLVELKLDVVSVDSIKKADYLAKEDDTISMTGRDIPIDNNVYFVYSPKVYQLARRKLNSFNNETHRKWKAVTSKELYSNLKEESDFQYNPENDLSAIEFSLLNNLSYDVCTFVRIWDFWKNKSISYYSSNYNEYKYISNVLHKVKTQIKEGNVQLPSNADDFTREYIDILLDEI